MDNSVYIAYHARGLAYHARDLAYRALGLAYHALGLAYNIACYIAYHMDNGDVKSMEAVAAQRLEEIVKRLQEKSLRKKT